MENCRFLKNILPSNLLMMMLQRPLMMDRGMMVMTTMMMN
jgi:hypothetical protein